MKRSVFPKAPKCWHALSFTALSRQKADNAHSCLKFIASWVHSSSPVAGKRFRSSLSFSCGPPHRSACREVTSSVVDVWTRWSEWSMLWWSRALPCSLDGLSCFAKPRVKRGECFRSFSWLVPPNELRANASDWNRHFTVWGFWNSTKTFIRSFTSLFRWKKWNEYALDLV